MMDRVAWIMAHEAAMSPAPAVQSQGASLSFTQGFLLGQLSIALLIFFFIKFFIFGEPPSADERASALSSARRARTLSHRSNSTKRTPSTNPATLLGHRRSGSTVIRKAEAGGAGIPSISTILAKTYYNVKGHQPESLDWFNVLVAQTIAQLRADARHDGAVLTSLNELLNGGSKPDWIGEIKVTEIALGDEYPIFSNCRVMPAEEGFLGGVTGSSGSGGGATGAGTSGPTDEGRLQARMDVDLSDVITLGVETTLVLNYPKSFVAVLPVALAVSVVRFSGTLAVSFIPSSSPPSSSSTSPSSNTDRRPSSSHRYQQRPNSTSNAAKNATTTPPTPRRPTTLAFTFLDDYRLDLSVRSLVGSRSRLQDVPKIAQLIESRVHAWFDERAVEPRFQQIVLPSLWPRMRNTRGGEAGSADGDGDGEDVSEDQDEEAVVDDENEHDNDDHDTQRHADAPQSTIQDTDPRRSKLQQQHRFASNAFGPPLPAMDLEARMEAEGAKLRAAEIKAGTRVKPAPPGGGGGSGGSGVSTGINSNGNSNSNTGPTSLRRDRERPNGLRSRMESGEWSAQRGMPGAMPGG